MSEIKPCPEITQAQLDAGAFAISGCTEKQWADASEGTKDLFRDDARAVIEVIWSDLSASLNRASDACASVQRERDELREMLGELRDLTMVEIGNGGSWSLEFDFGDGDENRDQMRQFADNLRAFLARYEGGR